MEPSKQKKYYHLTRYIIGLAFFVLTPTASLFSGNIPSFNGDLNQYSRDGHIRISWETDKEQSSGQIFELQRAEKTDFSDAIFVYKGPDKASFVSGIPNGTYFFRIRTHNNINNKTSLWSEPMVLVVEHHSLNKALWLSGLGAIVVLATVIVIIAGNQRKEN